MKIVIAPDSFKGSLSAVEVCNAVEHGIRRVDDRVEIIKVPIADGGEGTTESIVYACNGRYIDVEVCDPLLRKINARYGIIGDNIAIMEMAEASGLMLLKKSELNPMLTSTYGTGQLILSAIENGCKKIYLGIGGSATNDGGMGMAKALGARFLDKHGNEIEQGGGALERLAYIDVANMDQRLSDVEITVFCDVDNPLCGKNGASYIYGKQKGARKTVIKILDDNLEHFAHVMKRDLRRDILDVAGGGAAGGLGVGLMVFCDATLKQGVDEVLDLIEFDKKLQNCDLVFTGEGKIDNQTAFGKAPIGVAKRAKKFDIPVIAFAGSIANNLADVYDNGIDSVFSIISKPMSLENAIEKADVLLEDVVQRVMKAMCIKLR